MISTLCRNENFTNYQMTKRLKIIRLKTGNAFVWIEKKSCEMRTFLGLVLWCILFVLCWPIALVVLFLFPLVWLILLPFRIVGFTIEAVFKLVGAILLFPFKLVRAR